MWLPSSANQWSFAAAALAAALFVATPVDAQPAPPAQQPVAHEPSLGHTFAKTTTYMAASSVVLISVFTFGTGSLASGAVLTAGTIATAYVIYPTNEYLWEHYSPAPPPTTADGSFDVAASLWRNTAKYVTWKAGIALAKFGWIYTYTGSFASMLALGGSTSLALPLTFYVNNMAWDWYDWLQQQPDQAARPAGG